MGLSNKFWSQLKTILVVVILGGELYPMDFACRIMALPLQVSDSELLLFLGVKG